jgi:hypothetical protein
VLLEVTDPAGCVVFADDEPSAGPCEPLSSFTVGQQFLDRANELRDVTDLDQSAGRLVMDYFCCAAGRLCHDGDTGGHGLEHDQGKTLEAARVDEDVKGCE